MAGKVITYLYTVITDFSLRDKKNRKITKCPYCKMKIIIPVKKVMAGEIIIKCERSAWTGTTVTKYGCGKEFRLRAISPLELAAQRYNDNERKE